MFLQDLLSVKCIFTVIRSIDAYYVFLVLLYQVRLKERRSIKITSPSPIAADLRKTRLTGYKASQLYEEEKPCAVCR